VEDRPPAEAELVSRARRGDAAAFGTLVDTFAEIAFRTAYLVTADAAEAEDAAQEAFVKAYRALDRFREGSPFRPWLLRIVGNTLATVGVQRGGSLACGCAPRPLHRSGLPRRPPRQIFFAKSADASCSPRSMASRPTIGS
jgi:hypothetical protein